MKPVWIFLGIMVVCILLCQGAWAIEVFDDPPCTTPNGCGGFDGSWGHIALIFMSDAILAFCGAIAAACVIDTQRSREKLEAANAKIKAERAERDRRYKEQNPSP